MIKLYNRLSKGNNAAADGLYICIFYNNLIIPKRISTFGARSKRKVATFYFLRYNFISLLIIITFIVMLR